MNQLNYSIFSSAPILIKMFGLKLGVMVFIEDNLHVKILFAYKVLNK